MFLYKYNQYTGKYYKYDMDDYDIMTPMFDETLHIPDDQGMTWDTKSQTTCMFCGTTFDSRNKLFYHLGFMNIDIRKSGFDGTNEYDDDKGDFGMEQNTSSLTRTTFVVRTKVTKKTSRKVRNRQYRKTMYKLTSLMEDVKI